MRASYGLRLSFINVRFSPRYIRPLSKMRCAHAHSHVCRMNSRPGFEKNRRLAAMPRYTHLFRSRRAAPCLRGAWHREPGSGKPRKLTPRLILSRSCGPAYGCHVGVCLTRPRPVRRLERIRMGCVSARCSLSRMVKGRSAGKARPRARDGDVVARRRTDPRPRTCFGGRQGCAEAGLVRHIRGHPQPLQGSGSTCSSSEIRLLVDARLVRVPRRVCEQLERHRLPMAVAGKYGGCRQAT